MTGATANRVERPWARRGLRLEALVERSPAALVLGAITVIATVAAGRYTGRIETWLVQTDELQFVRLAVSIVDGSLHPELRGQDVSTLNQLYPALLAPLYGLLGTPDAFKAAHWLNAFLMSSAAIPAYLLARSVGVSKLAGYVVAALTVSVPWLALGDMVRDDAVAYPAFTWAAFAMQRALPAPSPRRDALALGAILVAALARTQFVLLGPVLLVTVALHEGLGGYVAARSKPSRDELIERLRGHWLLFAAAALALLYGAIRGFGSVLGSYQATAASGDLLPPGLYGNAAMHLSMVAVAIGVLPVTFAVGWAARSIVRAEDRRRHAYAVLLLVAGVAVIVAASSFVLRNAGTNPYDRYFFYIVPLALVGMAVCIEEGRRNMWAAAGAALLFALIAKHGYWLPALPPFHQSPVSAFNSVLDFHAGRVGLTGAEAARWGGLALGLAGAAALRFVSSRVFLPVLGAGLLVFGAAETRSVFRTMGGTQLGAPIDTGRDWIDRATPDGAGVAMLPTFFVEIPPGDPNVNDFVTARLWWDTEFWNKRVHDVYITSYDPNADTAPFPKRVMEVNPRTGRIEVTGVPASEQQPYVVLPSGRPDLRPAGKLVERTAFGLELIRVERPYRARWAVFGLDAGATVYAERPARVRLFEDGPAKVALTAFVPYQTTPEPLTRRLTLSGGRRTSRASATSGNSVTISTCLDGRGDTATLELAPVRGVHEPVRLRQTVVRPGAC